MSDAEAALFERIRRLGGDDDFQALLDSIPYSRFLGIRGERRGNELTFVLPFAEHLVGNPRLPALHGGVLGAFLETAAIIQLVWESDSSVLPKTIDVAIDYLRSGRPRDTYARATITKHGRRVANVRAEAWQDDRHRPIAAIHGHFLLRPRAVSHQESPPAAASSPSR